MPSKRITGNSVSSSLYEVAGFDGKIPHLIQHTGLVSAEGTHDRAAVPVTEMGPPLRADETIKIDAIGNAVLTEGEARRIKDFIDRHYGEHQSAQKLGRSLFHQAYCVYPHAMPLHESDGRYVRMRFSCAGFVFEAYRRARIELVDIGQLPEITLEDVFQAYPDHATLLKREEIRSAVGLDGAGPWRILLCGYLFNAMRRSGTAIRQERYTPTPEDKLFLGAEESSQSES